MRLTLAVYTVDCVSLTTQARQHCVLVNDDVLYLYKQITYVHMTNTIWKDVNYTFFYPTEDCSL